MPARKYTPQDYQRDRNFLRSIPSDMPVEGIHDGWLPAKRRLLTARYGVRSRIRPQTAFPAQIHRVFQNVYERAKRETAAYELRDRGQLHAIFPHSRFQEGLISLFKQEEKTPTDELSERIAITLDSCTDQELISLTRQFGERRLGLYAFHQ